MDGISSIGVPRNRQPQPLQVGVRAQKCGPVRWVEQMEMMWFIIIRYLCTINNYVMRTQRLIKAHQLLMRIEELRNHVATIANLTNPHVTESYEQQLVDELEQVDNLIQECLRCSRTTDPCRRNAG